ncbi:MAG: DNA polymerase Y family protein, partial [Acidimicrobiales bacterium]
MEVVRTLVVWCPDWPVAALGLLDRPAAVLEANRVAAASPAARREGVRVGLRRRDAQARCPELVLAERDARREARAFEPVVAAVGAFSPLVELARPGSCALPTRGPSRYFGGDHALAAKVVAAVSEALAGRGRGRVGVADG